MHGDADVMSKGPCRQCGDEQCLVCVVTRSQKKKEDEGAKKVQEEERREAFNTRKEEKRPSKENQKTQTCH